MEVSILVYGPVISSTSMHILRQNHLQLLPEFFRNKLITKSEFSNTSKANAVRSVANKPLPTSMPSMFLVLFTFLLKMSVFHDRDLSFLLNIPCLSLLIRSMIRCICRFANFLLSGNSSSSSKKPNM